MVTRPDTAPAIMHHPPSVSRSIDFIDLSRCRWHCPLRPSVRAPRRPASEKSLMSNTTPATVRKKAENRRVFRTRRALGSALVELMLTRNFDDISVQQVLDRARVGRATFYSHFRNKHDLLLSDAERFFEGLEHHFIASAGFSRRLAPVTELFSHVAEYHHFIRAVGQT